MVLARLAHPALLFVLTFTEARLLGLLDRGWLQQTAYAERKILSGEALWKAHQNRLLGPALVEGLAWALGTSFPWAHVLAVGALMMLSNALAYVLFGALTRDRRAALGGAAFCTGAFVALHDQRWLYVWDCVDLAAFIAFAYGVFARRGPWFFVALFAVELLNREAALFMSLWVMLDAVDLTRADGRRRLRVRRPWQLAGGAALTLLGGAWTALLREALWKTPTDALVPIDAFHGTLGNHLQLEENLQRMVWSVTDPAFEPMVPSCLALLGGYFWLHRRRLDRHTGKALVLVAALVAAILTVGVVHETRTLYLLIPFVATFHLAFRQKIVPQGATRDRGPPSSALR